MIAPVTLPCAGFALCAYGPQHAESLARNADDLSVARNMLDRFPHPYSLHDAEEWIGLQPSLQGTSANWAITIDDMAVGGIGLVLREDVFRYTAVLGYWIGASFRGRGIVPAAIDRVTHYAFASSPIRRIEAEVFAWNPASRRVLDKCGYACEGRHRARVFKDGRFLDTYVYARVQED